MKLNRIFQIVVCLAMFGICYAQNLPLSAAVDGNGNVYFSQSADECSFKDPSGQQINIKLCASQSLNTVTQFIDEFLQQNWQPVTGNDGKTQGNIYFTTDIDFGQMNSNGGCKEQHVPLTFKAYTGKIYGYGHTLKNLCYSYEVGSPSAQEMTTAVGLFKGLESVDVLNLNIENVRFTVDASEAYAPGPAKGAYYRPVGALAGFAKNTTIENVTLKKIYIVSPIAGGLIGQTQNVTLKKIFANDKIVMSNKSIINKENKEFAGQRGTDVAHWGSLYSVFVGGLVGSAVNTEFEDVELTASVSNESIDTTAVLGGVVGLLAGSKDLDNRSLEKIHIKNVKSGVSKATVLSGGRTMGGVFGEIASMYNNADNGFDVSIDNSSFDGKIEKAHGYDSVYVGGLIGRFVLDKTLSIKIKSSQSNIELNDSVDSYSANTYYAGGLVGQALCYSDASVKQYPEAHLSVQNTKVSGSLQVMGGASANSLLERQTSYMGGLAGYSCIAVAENAVSLDTVNVNLKTVIKKTSIADTTYVGGYFGKLRNKFNDTPDSGAVISLSRNVFRGSIVAEDDMNKVYAGGFVGGYYDGYTGHSIAFENLLADASTLLSVKANSGAVGGVCGLCYTPTNVDRIGVNGNVQVDYAGQTSGQMSVGGFFGTVPDAVERFNMSNSYFIGNLNVVDDICRASDAQVGYLAGHLRSMKREVPHNLISIYHYGDDDFDAFGVFEPGDIYGNWKSLENRCPNGFAQNGATCWDIRYNVRNGSIDSLTSSFNGKLTESSMKDDDLLDYLNAPFDDDAWKWSSKENKGLPYVVWSDGNALLPGEDPGSSSSNGGSSSSGEFAFAKAASWRIISMNAYAERTIEKTAEDVLYWWDEADEFGEYWQYKSYRDGDSYENAQGYWLWSAVDVDLKVDDSRYKDGDKISWNVDSLNSGWNLVSNPYGWYVSLSELDENVEVYCWNVNTADYERPTYLAPYEGAWIKANRPQTMTVDAKPMDPKKVKSLRKRAVDVGVNDGWRLFAEISDEYGKKDSWNIMGVGSRTVENAEPPAGFGEHVSLSIVEGKRALAKSIKMDGDEQEWIIKFSASREHEGYLKLEGIDAINALGKKVFVTVNGKTREMKPGESRKVLLKTSSTEAVVRVAASAKVEPATNLTRVGVARVGNAVNVHFVAPAEFAGSSTRIEFVSVSGKVAASLEAETAAGLNEFELTVPERGLYVMRIKAGSASAVQRVTIP